MKTKKIPCQLFAEDTCDGLVKCKVIIMNDGVNRNKTSFTKECMEDAEESLKNRPLLAYIKRDEDGNAEDFAGHERIVKLIQTNEGYDLKVFYLEQPIGIFPESCNVRYEEIDNECCMVADAYIWSDYSNEALDLLEDNDNKKDVSMEISCLDAEENEDGILEIKKFKFNAVTVIGSNLTQGMNGNCNITVYSKDNYEEFASNINQRVYALEKEENMKNEKTYFGLSVDNLEDQLISQINSRLVKTKDYWGDEYEHQEFYFRTLLPDENIAVVEDYDWRKRQSYGVSYTKNEDVLAMDFDNKKPYICEWREMKGGEPQPIVSDYSTYEEHLINKFNSIDTHEKELGELETLKTSFSELESKVKSMDDYEELKEFKMNYDKVAYEKQVEDVTSKFELDEEEVKDIKQKAINKEFSLEDYEKELFCLVGKKQMENKRNFEQQDKGKSNEVQVFDNVTPKYEPYGGLLNKYLNK